MRVCVTGHRPDKLYGYNMSDIRYMFLMVEIKKFLRSVNCTEAITGMALGVDLIFAQAVLELKQEGMDIKLTCAIPCQNHKAKWIGKPSLEKWVKKYDEVLEKCDSSTIVCDMPYNNFVMQTRNEWMVNRCDHVLAVFDGSYGGTKNCVDYARKEGKKISAIHPTTLQHYEIC